MKRTEKIKKMYPSAKALDEKVVNPFVLWYPISFDLSIWLANRAANPIQITYVSLFVGLLGCGLLFSVLYLAQWF